MNVNRKMLLVGFIVILSIMSILSGCASSKKANNEPVATTSKDPVVAKAEPVVREKWVHGVLTAKGDAGFQQMSLEKGIFDKLGIDIKIQEFESDATMAKALIAGQIDSMEANPSGTLVAISQGADLKFVGATIPGLSQFLYTKKDIKTIKDLKGKVVGISGPGALPQVLMQALLDKEGLGFNDVKWANAGGDAARIKGLISGVVDGVISSGDFRLEADKDPNIHYIASMTDQLPKYVRYTFIVSGETTKKRGNALTRVLQAEAEGLRYAIGHREETLALTAKIISKDKGDPAIALVYDTHVNEKLLAPNLKFDPAAIQWMYELNKKLGKIDKDIDVNKYIDLQFTEKAIQNIGEFAWPKQ